MFMLTQCCLLQRNVAIYFYDFSEKHVASHCLSLASAVESEGHVSSGATTGREDSFCGAKLQSAETYCSLHHNRAVISVLYRLRFSLFFYTLNLTEIYSCVGKATLLNKRGSFAVTLTWYSVNFCSETPDSNTNLSMSKYDVSCKADIF